MFAMDPEGVEKGVARPLVCSGWASRKLRRIAKSPLSAEIQAAADAVDALEWAVVFLAVILDPDADPSDESLGLRFQVKPVITDSRGLCDASRSQTAGLGLSERRSAIELASLGERMTTIGATWRWTNTTQQVAD